MEQEFIPSSIPLICECVFPWKEVKGKYALVVPISNTEVMAMFHGDETMTIPGMIIQPKKWYKFSSRGFKWTPHLSTVVQLSQDTVVMV